jgi:hypothetical protein
MKGRIMFNQTGSTAFINPKLHECGIYPSYVRYATRIYKDRINRIANKTDNIHFM